MVWFLSQVVVITVSPFDFCRTQAEGHTADAGEVAVWGVADHGGFAVMSDLGGNLSACGTKSSRCASSASERPNAQATVGPDDFELCSHPSSALLRQ
jgi:hypothetical protein